MVYVDEVVHVLRAGGDVQPVEFRFAAVADEGVEVVPAEADAAVESAGGEGAAVHLANARHAHVVGGVAFVHEAVMVEARAFFHQNLGDAVVEIGVFAKPDVAFDDCGFRFRAGDDEDARMGGEIAFAVGDKGEMDGALDARAGRDADDRAVRDEGGVERGEAVVFGARQATQPPADEVGGFAVAVNRARQAGYGRAVRLAQVGRELRREAPVDEGERNPVVRPRDGGANGVRVRRGAGGVRDDEPRPRDGGGVGVLPSLIAAPRGGEAEPREFFESARAQGAQPVGRVA